MGARPRRPIPRAEPTRARLLAAAALFAALELGLALAPGRFFDWGRAEPSLFLAFRPWLLLASAVCAAAWPLKQRAALYGLFLAAAGLGESLLLARLGGDPWAAMAIGWAAALTLIVPADLALQLARRVGGWKASVAAAVGLGLLLSLAPPVLRPYERLVLGPAPPAAATERPRLVLMTGLPLVWGEGGPFDPASRPAGAWRALQREFAPRPIDYLDAEALGRDRLLMIAQPRLLEPAELALLDRWVRDGGRLLLLVDPRLAWPSRLPLGDPRRPPPTGLVGPLLDHWGLSLLDPAAPGPVVIDLPRGDGARRLRLVAPGRWDSRSPACRVEGQGLVADCRLGGGRAILVADADLLADSAWMGPGADGAGRHRRVADNMLLVADWLDQLSGRPRSRIDPPVAWRDPRAPTEPALILGFAPALLLLFGAGIAARKVAH